MPHNFKSMTADVDLDACAVPTPEQIEQMETGYGAILTPRMALELGMKTAIGNVKRAIAKAEGRDQTCPVCDQRGPHAWNCSLNQKASHD